MVWVGIFAIYSYVLGSGWTLALLDFSSNKNLFTCKFPLLGLFVNSFIINTCRSNIPYSNIVCNFTDTPMCGRTDCFTPEMLFKCSYQSLFCVVVCKNSFAHKTRFAIMETQTQMFLTSSAKMVPGYHLL